MFLKQGFYVPSTVIGIYQEGGELVQGEPGGMSEDPMMQIIAMAEEALTNQDAEMAFTVCQALMETFADEGEEAPEMGGEMEGEAPMMAE